MVFISRRAKAKVFRLHISLSLLCFDDSHSFHLKLFSSSLSYVPVTAWVIFKNNRAILTRSIVFLEIQSVKVLDLKQTHDTYTVKRTPTEISIPQNMYTRYIMRLLEATSQNYVL